MEKQFPVGYVTREDQQAMAAGLIDITPKTGGKQWIQPWDFLARVKAGKESPVNEVTTYRKIIPQLCEYVCRFWNEVLYTPSTTMEEASQMPTDDQLDTMLEKHVYRQSLG